MPRKLVGVIYKVEVLNVVLVIAICLDQGLQFVVTHVKAEARKNLPELFWRHLKVLVSIKVLEEAFRVKPLSLKHGLKSM